LSYREWLQKNADENKDEADASEIISETRKKLERMVDK